MKPIRILILGLFLCFGLTSCIQSGFAAQVIETGPTLGSTSNPPELLVSSTPTVTVTETPVPPPTLTSTSSPTHPQPAECQQEMGAMNVKHLESDRLTTRLEYRLYTPPCYDQNLKQRYPVLYLLHGYGYNDDQWDRLGVDEIADKLITAGEISPLIIVMPNEPNHNIQPPDNLFGEALLYDLVRTVDTEFRTIPSKQYRAIGGLSRGGNWAIYLGLNNWEFFGSIGAHSAPLFISNGLSQIQERLQNIPPSDHPQIFLDIGNKDKWLQYVIRFEEILNDNNIPHDLYVFPGEHSEDYWSSHIEQYIRWYTKNW